MAFTHPHSQQNLVAQHVKTSTHQPLIYILMTEPDKFKRQLVKYILALAVSTSSNISSFTGVMCFWLHNKCTASLLLALDVVSTIS